MRNILIILTILMGVNTVSGQIIGDNVFAFGFKNIFKWNIMVLNEKSGEENIRMMMFEDGTNVKEKVILCALNKIQDKSFSEVINSLGDIEIITKLKNPYSENEIVMFKEKDSPQYINAFIYHFGYNLKVSYLDVKKTHDVDVFIELIKTYTNMKLTI